MPKAFTAAHTLLGSDSGLIATNKGATGGVTITLPKAAPGLTYGAFVAAAQTFTITPQSIDTIRGKALGASVAYGTVGGYMKLTCVVPLFWEVEFNIGPFA